MPTPSTLTAKPASHLRLALPSRPLRGPLAAWMVGDTGPLVVAVHGVAESGRYWRAALSGLSARHRVVVVDLLGFGRSPWPDLGYSLEAQADALAATLHANHLDTEPAVLLGHQAGASVALVAASRDPAGVAAVVGLAVPWFRSPAEARRALRSPWWMARWLAEHDGRARLLCHTLCGRRDGRIVPRLARWFAPGDVPGEVVEDAFLHTWASLTGTLSSGFVDACLPQRFTADAAVRVVALHGEDDNAVPVENLLDAACSRPWLTVSTLPQRGHNLAWSDPAAVVQAVEEVALSPRLRAQPSAPTGPPPRPARAGSRDWSLPVLVRPASEHTVGEAARLVRMGRRTVQTWVDSGRVMSRHAGNRVLVERSSLIAHAFGDEQEASVLLAHAWLSAAEAAARLGIGHATLARHLAAGMPSHRVAGRRVFLAGELDAWTATRQRGRQAHADLS